MTKEEYRAKKLEEFENLQINTCPEAFQESERKNIARAFLSQTIDELQEMNKHKLENSSYTLGYLDGKKNGIKNNSND